MDDTNQIEPPESFVALYLSRSGDRLTQPPEVVLQRYELCEDLAHTLAEQAAVMLFQADKGEQEVLERIRSALLEPGSAVRPPEAPWVVARLAELAGWEAPGR